eukprot:g13966.t1
MASPSVQLDGIDRGIAIFLLVFSIGFLAIGAVVMALFWRERNAFEIKQRSAYLVMLTGASFLAVICKIMVNQIEDVFGVHKDVDIAKAVKYFAIVCNTCCYGSRTILLWLRYHDRYRKAVPWLVRERYHVVACFLIGVAALVYPLYYFEEHVDNESSEDAFVERADEQLWIIAMVCKVIVIGLIPLVWGVHDIFNLRRELVVISAVLLVQIVVGKVVEDSPERVTRWVDSEKLDFAGAIIMFSVSVILPIKERLLHPMESSDPKEVEALMKRKGHALRSAGRPAWTRQDSDGAMSASGHIDDDDANTVGCASASTSPGAWTYERVMSMPEVSSAFEEFSRNALCQESFLFLKDATTYKRRMCADSAHGEGKDNGGGGPEGNGMRGGSGGDADEERFALLAKIVRDYIADGAPNEINISSRDKRSILEVHKLGKEGFRELPARDKRSVLAQAFSEIRFMVESNLMRKFLSTDGFKEAWAADRANADVEQQA